MPTHKFILPNVTASYSALDAFETCPRKYEASNFLKTVPFVTSEAMARGNRVHKFMEDYVKEGTPVPAGLTKLKSLVDKITPRATEVHAEQQIAINYDLKQVGYFAGDVAWRAKLDLTVLHPPGMIVVDYKTSSEPRETIDQLEMNILMAFVRYPDIERARGIFAYTDHKDRHRDIARTDIPRIVDGIYPRLERLRLAQERRDFPPTPCYLCKFCPVKKCQFNKSK
jgi:RecB family exonuclease